MEKKKSHSNKLKKKKSIDNLNSSLERKQQFLQNIQTEINDIFQKEKKITNNLAEKLKNDQIEDIKAQQAFKDINKYNQHIKSYRQLQNLHEPIDLLHEKKLLCQPNSVRSLLSLPKLDQNKNQDEVHQRGPVKLNKIKSKKKMNLHIQNLKTLCDEIKQSQLQPDKGQKSIFTNRFRNQKKGGIDLSTFQQSNMQKIMNNKKKEKIQKIISIDDSICNTTLENQIMSINRLYQMGEKSEKITKFHNLNDSRLEQFQTKNTEILTRFDQIFHLCQNDTNEKPSQTFQQESQKIFDFLNLDDQQNQILEGLRLK